MFLISPHICYRLFYLFMDPICSAKSPTVNLVHVVALFTLQFRMRWPLPFISNGHSTPHHSISLPSFSYYHLTWLHSYSRTCPAPAPPRTTVTCLFQFMVCSLSSLSSSILMFFFYEKDSRQCLLKTVSKKIFIYSVQYFPDT